MVEKEKKRHSIGLTCERVRDVHPPPRSHLPEQDPHHALSRVLGHARVVVDDGQEHERVDGDLGGRRQSGRWSRGGGGRGGGASVAAVGSVCRHDGSGRGGYAHTLSVSRAFDSSPERSRRVFCFALEKQKVMPSPLALSITLSSSTLLSTTLRLFFPSFPFLFFFFSLLPFFSSMGERPVRLPPELEDVPPRPLEVRRKKEQV